MEFKATVMTKSGIGIVQNGVEKSGQLGLEKTQGLDTLAAPPSRSSCETIETLDTKSHCPHECPLGLGFSGDTFFCLVVCCTLFMILLGFFTDGKV